MARRNKQNNYSIIDRAALRARKAYLDVCYEDLAAETGCSTTTLTAFFAGDERMKLDTIIKVSAAMGLRPRITFEPIKEGDFD